MKYLVSLQVLVDKELEAKSIMRDLDRVLRLNEDLTRETCVSMTKTDKETILNGYEQA